MRHVIVRYTVKADRVEENEQLVPAVYDELRSSQPAELRYATLKLDDGVSFVHIAATEDGRNPLADVAAFKQFQRGIADRCDEPPVVSEVQEIGSYRMFDS